MGKKRIYDKRTDKAEKQVSLKKIKLWEKPKVKKGKVYIQATYNNIILTVTDSRGEVICWESAGSCGFKGPKKATPYAAGVVAKALCEKIKEKKVGLEEVDVFIKGIGSGREASLRALQSGGLKVLSIKDVTPVPHNGCRPPKARRV